MGALTTHVLDTTRGKPGSGIAVTLFRINGDKRERLGTALTNSDGRCDSPMLEGDALSMGVYELVFEVAAYFSSFDEMPDKSPALPFLNEVVLRFGIAHPEQHYHVPLLVTPYSYSTYRGS